MKITARLRSNRGVTLLELLVVVAIIGILAMLVVPNIPEIIRGHRLRTANNDIVSKLRYIRGLAISKNRELEVTIDPVKQTLSVVQKAYTEYNLVDELNNYDINTTSTSDPVAFSKISGAPKVSDFTIFTEPAKPIHVIPRWDKSNQPIYEIPINYDLLQTEINIDWLRKPASALTADQLKFIRGKSGIASMTVNGEIASGTVTFMPSGIIREMKVEIGLGSKDKNGVPDKTLATGYTITIYKGGQITTSNL